MQLCDNIPIIPIQSLIHEGCLVPKSLYITIPEEAVVDHRSHPSSSSALPSVQVQNSSMYNAVDLKPGHVHEVVVRNDDPKSVLTWDFDVVKGFLHFTVYRTVKHVVYINGKCARWGVENGIQQKNKKSNLSILDPVVSVLDSSGIADQHVDRAEQTLVCQAMESVQVCNFVFKLLYQNIDFKL